MTELVPYPLLFEPIFVEKVWGGRALEILGRALPPDVPIGESWELADLPDGIADGRSVIANGPLAGRTLREAIAAHGPAIMGEAPLSPEGGFPLLLKYLDARENLSVQVHPDEAYAAAHPDAHLKSEAWIVVRAEPGAVIYKGVRPEVTPEAFRRHLETNAVVDDLVAVPVAPGDCHYLPSGTCHALGAGLLVAEVQTPSDTTFRVFDWGRTDRELHVDAALACTRFGEPPALAPANGTPLESGDIRTTPLVTTEFFTVERVDIGRPVEIDIVLPSAPEVWMFWSESARLETPGAETVDITDGATVLLPATLSGARASLGAGTTFLRINLPSTLRGIIA